MTQILEQTAFYSEAFGNTKRPGFAALRRQGMEQFERLGFPTGREESWRFTDTTPLTDSLFSEGVGEMSLPAPRKGVVVGKLSAHWDDVKDVLGTVAKAEDHPFLALNSAFFQDGVFIRIARGTVIEQPLEIIFRSRLQESPYVTHPRIVIVAEDNAQATILEKFEGPEGGVYWTNAVTEVVLAPGASIEHYKLQQESPEAFHTATIQADVNRSGTFTSYSIALGAKLSRNDIVAVLNGEGADVTLNGLFNLRGNQVADHHTTLDHAVPHTTSRELYKGVLDGSAQGVFDGKILIRKGAQKTSATQTNKNLLLSANALVHTKPTLEIHADDVKCKHGATIGQINEKAMFYLRSRGIGQDEARRMLIHAFAAEVLDDVKVNSIRAQLGGCLGLMALKS